MKKVLKNSIYLLLSFIVILSTVSCGGDNLKERLELAKGLDLYSYSFVFGDKVITDTNLVSTYEAMGFTFSKVGTGEKPLDLSELLEPGETAIIEGSLSTEKGVKVTLDIMNYSKESKAYRDCPIVRSSIGGNTSIIQPKGIYYNMSEKELVEILGEADEVNETDIVYIYNYYEYPYKVENKNNSYYSATGNGYSFTINKSTKKVDSFTLNMGFRPNKGLTEYSGLANTSELKSSFTTKVDIKNSYNGYESKDKLQTVITVNDVNYIIYIDSLFSIAPANHINKDLNYAFLFEKVCDPVNLIEFKPEWMAHNGNSGYSYGFRDTKNKYTCKMNFVNSQGYISSEDSYITPLDPKDKITDEAKQAFINIINTFSTNLQFEIIE